MSFRQTITRYTSMVIRLIIDLAVMGYGIGRKIVLPKRGRKGNLLYSIFFFFTALTERVIDFLNAVVGRWVSGEAWSFGKKYLRLAVLLVTWALCMLASLEWSASTESSREVSVMTVAARPAAVTDRIELITYERAGVADRSSWFDAAPLSGINWPPGRRQWLLFCTLRI